MRGLAILPAKAVEPQLFCGFDGRPAQATHRVSPGEMTLIPPHHHTAPLARTLAVLVGVLLVTLSLKPAAGVGPATGPPAPERATPIAEHHSRTSASSGVTSAPISRPPAGTRTFVPGRCLPQRTTANPMPA